MRLKHPFAPVYDARSRVLILGSFPSPKSREQHFYYGHPQNRFYRVLSELLKAPFPQDANERRRFLLDHGIAVWDVVAECDIEGARDQSIKHVVPNDISPIIKVGVHTVFANGGTAHRLYNQFLRASVKKEAHKLPSTSPANCGKSYEGLLSDWGVVARALEGSGSGSGLPPMTK